MQTLATQDSAALSFAFIFGLLFALWSANNGIKTLFEALNVAYDETEKRSFVWLNVVSFLFTLGAIVIGILFIVCVGVVPAVLAFAGLGGAEETLIALLRWPILIVVSSAAISVLYRYGPSRERAKWRWVTWGSALASVAWLVASILFSWYLANFADYNATYGSLGAVIGFMLWTWLSVVILLAGAELNAELEHQTARDSTTGAELPMGVRGATMADTLGRSRNSPSAQRQAEREAAEPMHFPDQEERRPKAKSVQQGSTPLPPSRCRLPPWAWESRSRFSTGAAAFRARERPRRSSRRVEEALPRSPPPSGLAHASLLTAQRSVPGLRTRAARQWNSRCKPPRGAAKCRDARRGSLGRRTQFIVRIDRAQTHVRRGA